MARTDSLPKGHSVKLFSRPTKEHDCEWRTLAASLSEELERLCTVAPFEDPDTSLCNAALLRRETIKLAAKHARCGAAFALAVADVQHSLDPASEEIGDVRIKVAQALLSVMRIEDSIGLLSTDHYAFLLGECGREGALAFTGRVGRALGSLETRVNGSLVFMSANVGVAQWTDGMRDFADLEAAARQQLNAFTAERGTDRSAWESRPASPVA